MSTLSLRIIATAADGYLRKLLTISVGGDNSFYLFPVRPSGHRWQFPSVRRNTVGELIDFEAPIVPRLDLYKLSIHPRGFLQTNDKKSVRWQDGIRVPQFTEMRLPFEVCGFAPSDPAHLPRLASRPPASATIEDAGAAPFILRLNITRSDSPLPPPNSVRFMFGKYDFGLAITCERISNATPATPVLWPPSPFFILPAASSLPPRT